ncbi:ABC transporter permease subunit, partial [Rhizocola hellebori]|uniref:ABC transporter permease subunit n=1 Tax=Rhizocola hellebori TaxID=1392758 RepID=UPI004032FAC5
MSTADVSILDGLRKWRVPRQHMPVLATLALLLVLYAIGVSQYRAFSNVQVVFNVFIDNGFLLVVAVGMTFVILTGGIDLSVGSVVAMTAMLSAWLLHGGLPPALVMIIALLIGPSLGFLMGCIIHYFEIQPFIVTLAGMFFARGMCTWISSVSIP